MATFNLCEDFKFMAWRRFHYTIEANSLEEALHKVRTQDLKPDNVELLGEELMRPDFQQNENSTHEIYDKDNFIDPIYKNGF